jgi:hypothetical protein
MTRKLQYVSAWRDKRWGVNSRLGGTNGDNIKDQRLSFTATRIEMDFRMGIKNVPIKNVKKNQSSTGRFMAFMVDPSPPGMKIL